MIGTGSTRLIDGSSFRLPRIGVYTREGVNLENQGVKPDVPVEVTPEDWVRGIDGQLLKAVDVVALDVKEWKRAKAGAAGAAIGAVPPAPPTPVAPMPHPRATPNAPRAARIPMAEG